MTNNKALGNHYEKLAMEYLGEKMGFWVTFLKDTESGQPCDIIATSNNNCYLFDIKHCEEDTFYFRNIRPNQITCFELAKAKGTTNSAFLIYFEKIHEWKALTFYQYKELVNKGEVGVKWNSL